MKLSLILVMAMAVLISAVPTGETDKANAVAEVANVEAGNANIVADVPNVHDDDPNGHDDDPDTEAFLASIGTDIANALADVPDVDVSTANPQDADPAGELAPDFCKNCEASYRLCLKNCPIGLRGFCAQFCPCRLSKNDYCRELCGWHNC